MSKKVLSLALVVVMLMSMFAFSTSAADLTEGQIGLRVETNAYVGMPAGETVEFKVYYVLPEGTDLETYRQASGNFAIGYSSAAYAIDTTSASSAKDARDWGASYDFLNPSAAVTVTAAVSNTIAGYADASYGWDKGCQVVLSYLSGAAYKAATGFPVDPECEVFTLRFITQKVIEATDTIGVVAGAYGQNYFKLNYWKSNTSTSNLYAKEDVDLSNIVSVPVEAAKKVYHVKNQIQWADKAANKVNLGIVCGFDIDDIGIAFENGTSTNVSSVGVTATINSVTDTYTERFVYSAKEGTAYYFRAVLGNVPADYNGTIEIVPFVVVDGTTEYGDPVTITADVLASNVAKLPA